MSEVYIRRKEPKVSEDYFATHPDAIYKFENILKELIPVDEGILEPYCGGGHLVEALEKIGYTDIDFSDISFRGFREHLEQDFLKLPNKKIARHIVTNPPYNSAVEQIKKCLRVLPKGKYLIMFLRLLFIEGQSKSEVIDDHPPKFIYVSTKRIPCKKNGDFSTKGGNAVCYAWFIWEKGYKGPTIIKRF